MRLEIARDEPLRRVAELDSGGLAGDYGTGFVGQDDGLDAVPQAKLGQQVADAGVAKAMAGASGNGAKPNWSRRYRDHS